jgi:hypothetical protein
MGAAKELGITVTAAGYRSSPTVELTWALILASDATSFTKIIRSGTELAKCVGHAANEKL